MATPKHIAVYLRVSTSKQDLQNQEPELKAWLEAKANGRPVKWYSDPVDSGASGVGNIKGRDRTPARNL